MGTAFHRLSPTLSIWHRYEPAVKSDLYSTALKTPKGVFLVDPIADLPGVLEEEPVVGIVVTNDNHARAAASLASRLAVPIHAHSDARDGLDQLRVTKVADGAKIAPGVVAITLPGAPAGEIALHDSADGGTLILGDALIHMDSQSFTFLPAKYCSNAKTLRRSLQKLLDYPVERILFAHGMPIMTRARVRLHQLLRGHPGDARDG